MARRRFQRSFNRPPATRMLEWASATRAIGNFAANAVTRDTLLDGAAPGHGLKQTCFRIVGYLHLMPNITGLNLDFHFGIYLVDQDQAGGFVALDPATATDIAIDKWMWHSSRSALRADLAGASVEFDSHGLDDVGNIPVDVKVKRIVGNNQRIELVAVANQNYSYSFTL